MSDDITIEWLSKFVPQLVDDPLKLAELQKQLAERRAAEPRNNVAEAVSHAPEPQKTVNTQIETGFRRHLQMLNAGANMFNVSKTGQTIPLVDEIALVINQDFATIAFNDKVFFYDGSRKIYTDNIGRYKAIIDVFADECGRRSSINSLQIKVYPQLTGINVYQDYPFNTQPNIIPFSNCCAKLNGTGTWAAADHSYLNLLTWILPIEFRDKTNPQLVYDVLNQWVEPEDVQFLIQIPAQALLQMSKIQPYKKSYLLSGGRDAAKSTYLDVLKKFFGETLVSSVPLQDIGQRFTHSNLEGKAINVYDDLADKALTDLGLFKALTGTFRHDIERKHEATYSGFINAVHIFSCNRPPKVPDANDEAFWSRWEYIVFPNSFDRDPNWFNRTITNEWLAAFADLVLKEYIRILNDGLMNKNTPVMVRDAWMAESTSEYQFVNTVMVKGMAERIRTDECYTIYQTWCLQNGRSPDNDRQFGKVLATMGITKARPRSGDKRYHEYCGIGLSDEWKMQHPELPQTDEKKDQKTL